MPSVKGTSIRRYHITSIDKQCNDRLVAHFHSYAMAYKYLVDRFPYMIHVCEEEVSYRSPYGSYRDVFQADSGSPEYYCLWKG